ncbi:MULTISPECIES: hypothetical protein [Niastella]|uniref:Uncharacterized protein n=1 Tax=Niastella soli TaxID=2821487 RepID=A0ABS3YR13_9BACT|nr:hypothetical protein [Niastella soli]MBO9200233.1 hypothetical protein [Niastella soli]
MTACALACAEAIEIDLVDYLVKQGHQPQKISHPDNWYMSPSHDERDSFFKVNRNRALGTNMVPE